MSCLYSFLASLETDAFFQFTVGLTREYSICIFINPLCVGAVEFRLMYFHLSSFRIIDWHSLRLLLRSIWNFIVRSLLALVKLLNVMKFMTFLWYSSRYVIIMELPLPEWAG